MLELFIPTKIKKYGKINDYGSNFDYILKNKYKNIDLHDFDSVFFEGITINSNLFLEDLIIICNGEFGEFYFIDYENIDYNFIILGSKIIGENNIKSKINEVTIDIDNILKILKSEKLLTNSKKEEIKNKIDKIFFYFSGIIFLLYKLKNKAKNSYEEMVNFEGLPEYEGQSIILKESLETKLIEIQANIDKLEGKIEVYISTIKSIIK